jgi:hypothetical protein
MAYQEPLPLWTALFHLLRGSYRKMDLHRADLFLDRLNNGMSEMMTTLCGRFRLEGKGEWENVELS